MSANHSDCWYAIHGDRVPVAGTRYTTHFHLSCSVKFGHFDILADEEVRQGLKTFSNWPTYPQLYVGGELIGGLDIVKASVSHLLLLILLYDRFVSLPSQQL